MKFRLGTRAQITETVTLDVDPAGSTIELQVDSTWHPATWLELATYKPPTKTNPDGTWTRRARTTGYFAGPDATANGATVLAAGSHTIRPRVTRGGDVVVAASTNFTVSG